MQYFSLKLFANVVILFLSQTIQWYNLTGKQYLVVLSVALVVVL